ncbi:TIGR04282 family arsenosugar biosynthesis glycosyltransferase [Halomonas sp. ML-15]|uniref:TIGR04282 family arsenosugar biosynthesis glycosyltransferase n=1 Tax=Halomonas sp. ML-15 TaxID=2773305 RepID=UPI0017462AA5|nr:TIGR04282 family arsenosugar biosynthesis glycosyltransferase [Halomonas sp. ML-15]MBD3895693.1 TIGR04282 family arsenosugar biosynthesis glycosyltransferase [Halomonas sp. ML-15]
MPADAPLAILAKAPIPGLAKTRLIPALGDAGAARLHERLLRHTLRVALDTTSAASITLWTALDHDHPVFREMAEHHGILLRPQPEGTLGVRIHQAFHDMPEPGLLVGTDCPVLTPALLARCHHALSLADVVMLPAEDGGYGLIGVRHVDPRLFDGIAWGTGSVMDETRQRIAALGWQLDCPATVWDVDRPEDLPRLAAIYPGMVDDA